MAFVTERSKFVETEPLKHLFSIKATQRCSTCICTVFPQTAVQYAPVKQ